MPEHKITVKEILDPQFEASKRIIKNDADLKKIVTLLKKNGYKIVLTQGVWDLIHIGHAQYLQKAKNHGDILIVGIDSDALTKKRKGPNRPIVPQDERMKMISHLRYVDIVFLREIKHGMGGSDKVLQIVKPDVLVVSMTNKDIGVEKMKAMNEHCGKVVSLIHQATTSTTARIRNLTIDGIESVANKIKRVTEDFINDIKNGKSKQ